MGLAVAAMASGRQPRQQPRSSGKEGARLLADVPLFAGLSERHLRKLGALAQEVRFPAQSLIVQAGQPGRGFFVLLDGAAKVTKDASGAGRALARLRPGDFFGEFALLDGGPRTATVVAESPVVALRLSRTAFRQMLSKEPQVAVRMLEGIAARARTGARIGTE
jgi:CRP-like cAMP-binding protein